MPDPTCLQDGIASLHGPVMRVLAMLLWRGKLG